MVGEEAAKLRSVLELSHPLDNGIVKDWDMMIRLWEHGLYEKMKIAPKETTGMKVLLTEAPLNPKPNREKMAEIMFEKFGFSAVRVCAQATLALYSEVYSRGFLSLFSVLWGTQQQQTTTKNLGIADWNGD